MYHQEHYSLLAISGHIWPLSVLWPDLAISDFYGHKYSPDALKFSEKIGQMPKSGFGRIWHPLPLTLPPREKPPAAAIFIRVILGLRTRLSPSVAIFGPRSGRLACVSNCLPLCLPHGLSSDSMSLRLPHDSPFSRVWLLFSMAFSSRRHLAQSPMT